MSEHIFAYSKKKILFFVKEKIFFTTKKIGFLEQAKKCVLTFFFVPIFKDPLYSKAPRARC